MNKARKLLGTAVRRSVPLAIIISSIAASASLAISGLAPLWGSPGNITTEVIANTVHFVAYMLAWRNEDVADIWLLQVPIAFITYMLIIVVPLVIGCSAVEVWQLCHEKGEADGVDTP
ncbi:MAG: hypothetical protein ACN6QT_06120 [Burkholderia contaminans]|uniref:Uncharacterized protein n=1 Tax=Burkholderia aenigmatica TaxID=2015348 RepID=A0A228HPV2_9BURK|nr:MULTISPECIES: hypothetical protein [Burkholderia cepacia complex]KVS19408.1 hypothetical protein WK32_21385 [Burkholderia vietnamiensis]MBR8009175.1 hypothetical protein [Burkholderia vietnamiensis]MBR8151526.1 hypothetical protein [Burkholderia vietnamiensis]MBR8164658.1 hypothetical protein [Burkholderia vietnamiensis]MBR8193018.1 hypothetical protein [Burkholderia vietnamiensis]